MPTDLPFAFFGTPYVARDTLAALIAAGYVPSVVITSPDAPRGRGLELTPSETRVFAESQGIPVLAPAALDDAFLETLRAFGTQYAVAVAYGKLLPQTVINAFPLGILNIHYSLLPNYRGASPVEAALLAGDAETGVTVQRLVLKMDAGDIIAQRTVLIEPDDTSRELRSRLIDAGATLLIETLPAFISGTISATPQDEHQATFAGKITKERGLLSLSGDPETNWRTYRAFHESPGTFFYARKADKRIRVKIRTATKRNSAFIVERVIPESKAEQDFQAFLSGGWLPE